MTTNPTARYVWSAVIPAAFALLPSRMDSRAARAQIMAIGMQESGLAFRRQHQNGPARGFWQFERDGGCKGVMRHDETHFLAEGLLRDLAYPVLATPVEIHAALEHNDVLACAFARLLLWTDPLPLPGDALDADAGWDLYLSAWRPGKPHSETWAHNFETGWMFGRDLRST